MDPVAIGINSPPTPDLQKAVRNFDPIGRPIAKIEGIIPSIYICTTSRWKRFRVEEALSMIKEKICPLPLHYSKAVHKFLSVD